MHVFVIFGSICLMCGACFSHNSKDAHFLQIAYRISNKLRQRFEWEAGEKRVMGGLLRGNLAF